MSARAVAVGESENELRGLGVRDLPRARSRMHGRDWWRFAKLAALVPCILVAFTLTLALVYRVVTPPSTLMLGRWLTGQSVMRAAVPLDAISPLLVQGVIAAEDQRFCMHDGVDWEVIQGLVEDENGPSRGGSTITMQTVKNVFLWGGRSYVRKLIELPLSLFVDVVWGKRRTLEIYLNIVEWGDGLYGAEAAAQYWFHKSARKLTRREAALLVSVMPNPIERHAGKPSPEVRARAAMIEGRMDGMDELMGCLKR